MRVSRRKLRLHYTICRLLVLWLAIVGTVGINHFLVAKEVSNAGLIATAVMFLPGVYAFYTFRVMYALSGYREELRTSRSRP